MSKFFSYTRRSFITTIFNLVIFVVIGIRLFFLQIIKSKEYSTLSKKNSIKLIFIEPKRGQITDTNQQTIASSKDNFKLMMYRQRDHNPYSILERIYKIVKFSPDEKKQIYKKIKNALLISPITLKESLDWSVIARIESDSHMLPGVFVEKGYKRFYPDNNLYAHVIGYMGPASNIDIQKYGLFHNRRFKVGVAGIEKSEQKRMMGKFGMKSVEINAYRRIIRNLDEIHSIPGKDIHLTMNKEIQSFSMNAVNSKVGSSVVVMSTKTGRVLSMISTPNYNPNLFSTGISTKEWEAIIKNPSLPLTNKTISKLYPPGSIWKIVVAIAILESGVSPNTKIECKGYAKVGRQKFKCWKHSGHGFVDLKKALMTSCNPYFYVMSQKVGIKKIHEVAQKFGFGQKTGISLPGELSGLNPNKRWKELNFGSDWLIGDTINSSIGQGFTLSTPLQMVTLIARLATGQQISPSIIDSQNINFKKLDIKPEYLKLVSNGLVAASNNSKGTGYKNRIKEKKYRMASKTGTAQVVSRDTSNLYDKNDQHLKSHSIFTGFAPIHDPEYAAVVVVDHGGWGSKTAAPIGRDILHFTQKTLAKI